MEELVERLNEVPGTYFGFVAGIVNYAKKKPERLERIMEYLNNNNNLTTSDIVHYVMMQQDFHEDGVSLKEMAG